MKPTLRPGAPVCVLLAVAATACGAASEPGGAQPLDGGVDGPAPIADVMPRPGGGAAVQFGLHTGGQATGLPVSVGGVTVQSAVLALHELTVASDNGAMKIEGGRPVDLTAGTVTLPFSMARPGLYSRLLITFEPPEGAATAAFGGLRLSARVTGTLASGVPFAINVGGEFGIELVAPTPFDLKPGAQLVARVRFDLGQWFAGITFPASPDPLTIDAARNPEIVSRFRTNLVQSATLSFE
jgi:hypothetical protein